MDHLYGWGRVKIEIEDGYSAVFDTAYFEPPDFDPKSFEWEDENGDITVFHQGDRAYLRGWIYNLSSAHLAQLLILVNAINQSRSERVALKVYPKYNENAATNYYYDCVMTSHWKPEDLTTKQARGQKIPLEFKSLGLLNALPSYTVVDISDLRITEDGVTRITEDDIDRITD